MWDDETESNRSVHVAEPAALPQNTHKSENFQMTNLLECKKTSIMVSPPDIVPDQIVVDVAKLSQEVSPRNTNFQTFSKTSFVYVLVTHTTVTWSQCSGNNTDISSRHCRDSLVVTWEPPPRPDLC
jgi:hypothetical protein